MDNRPLLFFSLLRAEPSGGKYHELCADSSALKYKETWVLPNFFRLFIQDFAKQVGPGARKLQKIEKTEEYQHLPDGIMHAFHHPEGIISCLVADEKYDKVAAQMVMNKAVDKFIEEHPRSEWGKGTKTFNPPQIEGENICTGFKDPSKVNKLAAIQKDLDETMDTLRNAIQQTTVRGEHLDNLVQKSDNLNSASKMFYQQARKQNSCCVLM